MRRVLVAATVAALAVLLAGFAGTATARTATARTAAAGAASPKVTWMPGARAPGTPARYDKVGVLRIGPRTARNVLVLEPGTSAGSAYFAPLAKWVVARDPGWQVWAVERRENLLEDQSVLAEAKRGTASATRRRRQRHAIGGAATARPALDARPPAPPFAADLRLRCPARRRSDPGRDPSTGPAVRDSVPPADADRPPRVLRPQRSCRRVPA